jgi:flagellar protein FlaI
MYGYSNMGVVRVSGTGNDGLDFNLNREDKKNFYGLVKKKQQTAEQAAAQNPAAQAPPYPPEEEPSKGLFDLHEQQEAEPMANAPEPAAETMDVMDKRSSRLFGGAEPQSTAGMSRKTFADEPVPEPEQMSIARVAEPEVPKSSGLFGSVKPEVPIEQEIRQLPSQQGLYPPSGVPSKSEEDIVNEFNSIIKPAPINTAPDIIQETNTAPKPKAKKEKKTRVKLAFEPYDPEVHGQMAVFTGVEGYEEVERYWVIEPYAFIVILYNESTNNYLYYVVEPSLTLFESELLKEVYERLQDVLIVENLDSHTDKKIVLTQKTTEVIQDYIGKIDTKSYYKILYYITRDYLQFGKIDSLMHDNFIEDISNNGFDTPVFLYHKNYENIMTNITFNEQQLDSFVIRLAQRCGKHISIAEPMIDAMMPDGSRIQMTLGKEITTRGSTFTIRKFKEVPITPIDLLAWNTFSSEAMAYLWLCIENNKSLIFSGGTASGKTSSLNAVSLFIPPKAKVISLEDTRELKLPHINWIPGLTRDSFTADGRGAIEMFDLLKSALRQRPEYLLVGEVRGKEALTLFQAMSTGHTTFSTMHADSVESAIHRLENPPISVPRTMITALDIVSIQAQTYLKNKRVRRNMKLVEIHDIDPNSRNIRTNDVFNWNSATDKFDKVGESTVLADIAQRRAWSKREIQTELLRRQRVLEYMLRNNVRDFKQISAIIHAYAVKPDKVLEKLGIRD